MAHQDQAAQVAHQALRALRVHRVHLALVVAQEVVEPQAAQEVLVLAEVVVPRVQVVLQEVRV